MDSSYSACCFANNSCALLFFGCFDPAFFDDGPAHTELLHLFVSAASGGRFAEDDGGNTEPPLTCVAVSGGRLEDAGSRKEATAGTGKATCGVNSGYDLVMASVCAPAEVRDRELERDRGGGGGKIETLAGTTAAATAFRERERDRGGGSGICICVAVEGF